MRKRIISMLLTVAMVMTLLPTAFAAEGGTSATSVKMGDTELANGIYVPATSQYDVVSVEGTNVPEGGFLI